MLKNKKVHLFLAVIFLVCLWLSGLFWFVRDTAGMTPPAPLKQAEAIVVLTGGSNRIETGFSLLKQGMGRKVFISGVYRGIEVKALMKMLKQEGGDKAECCVALGGAENTIENAAETSDWLAREGFRTFYLVTANYHMRRALLEFSNVSSRFDITPYPVFPDKLDMKLWWKDETFRGVIVREYCKYLLALLRSALIKGP